MRKFVFLLVICTYSFCAFSQDKVYDNPDQVAEFPGGRKVLEKFIDENLVYPREAMDSGYQGKAIVGFLICEDGTCQNFKMRNGIADCPSCDRAIINVLRTMSKWKPALVSGKAVASNYNLMVTFKAREIPIQKELVEEELEVFADPETPADFPGGQIALRQFINDNMIYPADALKKEISGKCYVRFIVGKDGVCRDFKVVKGIPDCPQCDEEAIRLLKSMPKWNPGLLLDTPIDMTYSIPVVFKLP
ncbi:MAG: energy transducer TonB [Fluviicola sp.]